MLWLINTRLPTITVVTPTATKFSGNLRPLTAHETSRRNTIFFHKPAVCGWFADNNGHPVAGICTEPVWYAGYRLCYFTGCHVQQLNRCARPDPAPAQWHAWCGSHCFHCSPAYSHVTVQY